MDCCIHGSIPTRGQSPCSPESRGAARSDHTLALASVLASARVEAAPADAARAEAAPDDAAPVLQLMDLPQHRSAAGGWSP
jgi:hypothetical protein